MTDLLTPGLEHQAERAHARRGFLLGLPAMAYLLESNKRTARSVKVPKSLD